MTTYRVLLVDDDAEDRLLLCELLEEIRLWHAETVCAATYEEALQRIEGDRFDIALVDYRLGARRGSELLAEPVLRSAGLPVVILTGQDGVEADLAAGGAGAVDFLPKRGLDPVVLERTIRYAVENRRRQHVEARFRALVEGSRDLVTILDGQGRIEYVSPSLVRTLGFEPCDKLGADAMAELHPEDAGRVAEAFAALRAGQEPVLRLQYRVAHRDGSWRVLDTVAQNFLDDPLIRGVVVNSWDVTDIHRMQEKLRFKAELLQCVGQPLLAVDDAHRVTYWNKAAEDLTGYTADEVLGRPILEQVVLPTDHEAALAARAAVMAGRPWHGELRVMGKDGTHRLIRATVTPTRTPSGAPGGRIAIGSDITEVRRAEEERREAADRVRFQARLLDAVGQAVIATDLRGRVTYWNRAAEALYGWTEAEALGRPIVEVTPTDANREQAGAILAALRRGEQWTGEFEVQRRDGTRFWALITDAPILDDEGRLVGIIGVSSDLTSRRELEEQLRQAQKMEAIGRLAGGVAHDFNNVLTAITGHANVVLDELPDGSPLRPDVSRILDAGERAASLTQRLLAFSRKQVLDERTVNLAGVVRALEPMLRRLVPERIALRLDTREAPSWVRADAAQLDQVLLNLVVNAVDAIEDVGAITVAIDSTEIGGVDEAAAPLPPGGYARLTVSDDGIGMAPEVAEHIFEPFFTTKPEGRGTGLGLATVYGIVTGAGGHVLVDTAPGRGATFRVLLPLREAVMEAPTLHPVRPGPQSEHHAVVLLVEDDVAVRTLATRVLERAGHRVLQARNGREALEIADRQGELIDVVVSDLVMPEMGGVELVKHLRERHPDLRIVLMSGYPDSERRGEPPAGIALLAKPFGPSALLEAIGRSIQVRAA